MRPQPNTDRGRASRQRIVRAACELFYRRGVAATGISEIAEASGTGKGQLYHYFEDKPDLVLAVIGAQVQGALQPQRQLLAEMTEADDLRAWADQAVAQHGHGGPIRCPLGTLVVELADRHPELRDALDAGFQQWRTGIATALARLQERGHVVAGRDADDLAEILLCAYEGGVLLSEVHGNTRSLRVALGAAVDSMVV